MSCSDIIREYILPKYVTKIENNSERHYIVVSEKIVKEFSEQDVAERIADLLRISFRFCTDILKNYIFDTERGLLVKGGILHDYINEMLTNSKTNLPKGLILGLSLLYTVLQATLDIYVIILKILATSPREIINKYLEVIDKLLHGKHEYAFELYPEALVNDAYIFTIPIVIILRLLESLALTSQGTLLADLLRREDSKIKHMYVLTVTACRLRAWFDIIAHKDAKDSACKVNLYKEFFENILRNIDKYGTLAEFLLALPEDTRIKPSSLLAHLLATSALALSSYIGDKDGLLVELREDVTKALCNILALRLAALFHDIGKLVVSKWKERRHAHAEISASILNNAFSRFRLKDKILEFIYEILSNRGVAKEFNAESVEIKSIENVLECVFDKVFSLVRDHHSEKMYDKLLNYLVIGDWTASTIDRSLIAKAERERRECITRSDIVGLLQDIAQQRNCFDIIAEARPEGISTEIVRDPDRAVSTLALVHADFRQIKKFVEDVSLRVQLSGGSKIIDEESFVLLPAVLASLFSVGIENALVAGGGKLLLALPATVCDNGIRESVDKILEAITLSGGISLAIVKLRVEARRANIRRSSVFQLEFPELGRTTSLETFAQVLSALTCYLAVCKSREKKKDHKLRLLATEKCAICSDEATIILQDQVDKVLLEEVLKQVVKKIQPKFERYLSSAATLLNCFASKNIRNTLLPRIRPEYVCAKCVAKTWMGIAIRERRKNALHSIIGKEIDFSRIEQNEMEYIGFGVYNVDLCRGTEIPHIGILKSDGSLMRIVSNLAISFADLLERSLRIDAAMRLAQTYVAYKILDAVFRLAQSKRIPEDAVCVIVAHLLAKLGLGFAYAGGDDYLALVPAFLTLPMALMLSMTYARGIGYASMLQVGALAVKSKAPLWAAIDACGALLDGCKDDTRVVSLATTYSVLLEKDLDKKDKVLVTPCAVNLYFEESSFTTDEVVETARGEHRKLFLTVQPVVIPVELVRVPGEEAAYWDLTHPDVVFKEADVAIYDIDRLYDIARKLALVVFKNENAFGKIVEKCRSEIGSLSKDTACRCILMPLTSYIIKFLHSIAGIKEQCNLDHVCGKLLELVEEHYASYVVSGLHVSRELEDLNSMLNSVLRSVYGYYIELATRYSALDAAKALAANLLREYARASEDLSRMLLRDLVVAVSGLGVVPLEDIAMFIKMLFGGVRI